MVTQTLKNWIWFYDDRSIVRGLIRDWLSYKGYYLFYSNPEALHAYRWRNLSSLSRNSQIESRDFPRIANIEEACWLSNYFGVSCKRNSIVMNFRISQAAAEYVTFLYLEHFTSRHLNAVRAIPSLEMLNVTCGSAEDLRAIAELFEIKNVFIVKEDCVLNTIHGRINLFLEDVM